MATTIVLKNSVTTTNTPTSLAQGEVAINVTDKKVWVGNAATTPIQIVNGGPDGVFTSVTDSGLTSTRVTYAGTGGLLKDSANMTFDGTSLTLAGGLGVGANLLAGTNIYVAKNLTGATSAFNIDSVPTIQSDVTGLAASYFSFMTTQAAAFTLTSIRHYDLASVTIGSGSTVTNQIGYYARTLTTGTNNYAFQGTTAAATGAYNLYMSGTANNYLAGALGIGTTTITQFGLRVSKTITGNVNSGNIRADGAIQSDVTTVATYYNSSASTAAAAFTLTTLYGYYAGQGTFGSGSAVTSQYGYHADTTLIGATNNYAFRGQIAAATGRYNLYMDGTAVNYLAGDLGVGTTTTTGYGKLTVQSTSSAVAFQLKTTTNVNGIYSTLYEGFFNTLYSYGSQFIVGTTDATDFVINTNNTERMRISSTGNVLVTGAGGLGYGTGSGGAVTQATSRTTGVTLNKTNGAITLVSAAGSVAYQSFTVTNSTVAATDTIIVNQKSGTDLYRIYVTAVAAGSFQITFATTAGVTTEQPVFNFAVIKAVVA